MAAVHNNNNNNDDGVKPSLSPSPSQCVSVGRVAYVNLMRAAVCSTSAYITHIYIYSSVPLTKIENRPTSVRLSLFFRKKSSRPTFSVFFSFSLFSFFLHVRRASGELVCARGSTRNHGEILKQPMFVRLMKMRG